MSLYIGKNVPLCDCGIPSPLVFTQIMDAAMHGLCYGGEYAVVEGGGR